MACNTKSKEQIAKDRAACNDRASLGFRWNVKTCSCVNKDISGTGTGVSSAFSARKKREAAEAKAAANR